MKKNLLNRLKWIKNHAGHDFFDCVIESAARKNNDFFFIQIGACDGMGGDPIRKHILKHGWKGILVEPAKDLFHQLKENYKGRPGLLCENAAVAVNDGVGKLYRFKKNYQELPDGHFIATASLLNNFRERYADLFGNIDGRITSEEVSCLTFDSLLRKHRVRAVDLLCIDAEGYDDQILASIDFEKVRPDFILYEQHLLNKTQRLNCHRLLHAQGYKRHGMAPDVFAYRRRKFNFSAEAVLKTKACWRTFLFILRRGGEKHLRAPAGSCPPRP